MSVITFGTDGWRAKIAEDFTFENVQKVTSCIASYLKETRDVSSGVVVGFDTRFLSETFASRAAKILSESGIPVILSREFVPTPVTAYSVLHRVAAGALMFTASHNPPEYQGIKFIPWYAGPALGDVTGAIEEKLKATSYQLPATSYQERKAVVKRCSLSAGYFKHIKTLIDFKTIRRAKLRVSYDPLYAAGRGYVDKLLHDAGCDVTIIHDVRDPLFGGTLPDPQEKNLQELKKMHLKLKTRLAFATDGDADRFSVFDEKGRYYSPNDMLSLFSYYLLKYKGFRGPLARTCATTHLIDEVAKRYNCSVVETPVGFKFIGKAMRENNAILGGEESGGFSMKGHIPEKDGILACLLATEMVAALKKPLSKIHHEFSNEIGKLFSKRMDLHLTEEIKTKILSKLKEDAKSLFPNLPVERVNAMDGFKFALKDKAPLWFMIRASGTEPVLRIYMEAENPKKLGVLQKEVIAFVRGFGALV